MAGNPKLIILSAQYRGKQFELTEDMYTVGRVDDRDICIKDSTISSHHCDFIKTADSYLVRDNASTNGTRVNNVPVTEQELQNSDIVQIGGIEVLFDNANKTTETTEHQTRTNIFITGELDANSAAVRRAKNATMPVMSSSTSKTQKIFLITGITLGVLVTAIAVFIIFHLMN